MSGYPQSTNRFCGIILFIFVAGRLAIDLYLPSLPALVAMQGASRFMAQATLLAFFLGFASLQVILSILSDHYGRRPMLQAAAAIYVLGSLLAVFSTNMMWFVVARFIQGCGVGALYTLARVVLRDRFLGQSLAGIFSLMAGVTYLVPALAPLAGAAIQVNFGVMMNFIVILAVSVAVYIAVWRLPETLVAASVSPLRMRRIIGQFQILAWHRVFVLNIFYAGLGLAVVVVCAAVHPFLFQKVFHFTPVTYAWVSLGMTLGLVGSFFLSRVLLAVMSARQVIFAGFMCILIAAVCLVMATAFGKVSAATVIIPSVLATFAVGFIIPNAEARVFHEYTHMLGVVGAFYSLLHVSLSAFIECIR